MTPSLIKKDWNNVPLRETFLKGETWLGMVKSLYSCNGLPLF